MPDTPVTSKGQPGIAAAALFGLCPRCGARTLFAGLARFAPTCRVCALDFSRFDVGDGPAAFLILIIGGLVSGLSIGLQLAANPPYWLQALIWVPVTTALVIGGLRVAKAALLASEFRHKAGEGRERQ
jgi:uncharacterized protein (DUF983 family)